MAVPRTPLGGMFGGGAQPGGRPTIDVGSALDALTRGASTLIQGAYVRHIAEQNRQDRLAQQQQAREDRQFQRDALEQDRVARRDTEAQRLQLERDKMAAQERQHRETQRTSLRAKGLATTDDATTSIDVPADAGAPPVTVAGIDPRHFQPDGPGLYRDIQHNPGKVAADARAATEANVERRFETTHGETHRHNVVMENRTPGRTAADPVERARRSYVAQRVPKLMAPRKGKNGLPVDGLSLDAALNRAHEEADGIFADPTDESPAPPEAIGPHPTGDIDLRPAGAAAPVVAPQPPPAAPPAAAGPAVGARIRLPASLTTAAAPPSNAVGARTTLPRLVTTAQRSAPPPAAPGLSAAQKALAQQDAGFARHLRALGYTPDAWVQP